MPRLPRLIVVDQAHHVIQRGNNRQPIFAAPSDYRAYVGWLAEASGRCFAVRSGIR